MKSLRFCIFALLVFYGSGSSSLSRQQPAQPLHADLEEAARLVSLTPKSGRQYNYIVTAGIRFLLFWVSRDDVGHGYIRMGTLPEDPETEMVELLMGSDPAKAPLGVNRWGAAAEVWRRKDHSGAFFGFMKSSKGDSVSAARDELSREQEVQKYPFEGIIIRTHDGRAVSTSVPINAATDFTLNQLPMARQMVIENLKAAARAPRVTDGRTLADCANGMGFLFTLRDLIDAHLAGQKAPMTRCYVYAARRYTISIRSSEPVVELKVALKMRGATRKVERTYRSLRRADFRVVNTVTGLPTDFQAVFGESGELRGIPIQFEHQPNWWFRVTINLHPELPLKK